MSFTKSLEIDMQSGDNSFFQKKSVITLPSVFLFGITLCNLTSNVGEIENSLLFGLKDNDNNFSKNFNCLGIYKQI